MHLLRRYFSKGTKNKIPFMHQRMRDDQVVGFDPEVIIQQDIEINGAGSPSDGALAAHLFFGLKEKRKKLMRWKAGLRLCSHIHEIRLVNESPGLCLDQRRASENPDAFFFKKI